METQTGTKRKSMGKVAVVILNWNGKKLLDEFLPSVVKYSSQENVELYVVDNASIDDSVVFLKQNFPQIKILIHEENFGFAGGYNKALKQIEADYYLLLNSDVEVTENWLQPLVTLMESNPNIAACQPKVLAYRNKSSFEHAGASGGFIDKNYFPFCRGRIFNEVEQDNGQYNDSIEVFWATGAAFMVRSDAYHKAGGLDEEFFAHMEEIDLCWRLKNRGFQIYVEPNSVVYHLGGATLEYMNPRKTMLNFRNCLYMIYKNTAQGKFFGTLVIRLFYDTIAGLKFLASLQFSHFWAVIKAHFKFWVTMSHFKAKRRENILQAKNYQHQEIYNGSIVKDFYLSKKKRFTDLGF